MTKPLPKWIMRKYATLWRKFRDKEFEHSQAEEILKENTSVIISFLKKNDWLSIRLNPEDSRKRLYILKSPEKAIGDMKDEEE